MKVIALYTAGLDDEMFSKDDVADKIFKAVGAKHIGRGMMIATRERDIEYEVADGLAQTVASQLIAAGFKVDCP
jgi:hypothetical protein